MHKVVKFFVLWFPKPTVSTNHGALRGIIFSVLEASLVGNVVQLLTLAENKIHNNIHRTKSHVSVFLKRDGNMQLHVSVMFNMHKKWSGSVVYAATETRENVTKPVTETQVIRRVSRTV